MKHYSATIAELAKSLRKVLSIAVSFLAYAKPVTGWHEGGRGHWYGDVTGVRKPGAGE